MSANYGLSRIKAFPPQKTLVDIYCSWFESHLHFGLIVWGCAISNILYKLQVQQKKTIRHIMQLIYDAHTAETFKQ